MQRVPGAAWVHLGSRNLRHVKGLDRLPDLNEMRSFVIVANHRSYFDLFVISMLLFRHGLKRRILFPVRSNFFYDNPLGFFVNGVMSWWSMYPPVFRDRTRASLNRTSLEEIAWTLTHSQSAVGIHPEGRRNRSDDAYAILPAQAGLGRVVQATRAPVVPVFINGLGNSFARQVWVNLRRRGKPIVVVFGEPVEFDDLLDRPDEHKNHRAIAARAMESVARLAEEERSVRAELERGAGRPDGVTSG
jgi:1-acyl-sn-glycerol-3-phosphate acyltransferase